MSAYTPIPYQPTGFAPASFPAFSDPDAEDRFLAYAGHLYELAECIYIPCRLLGFPEWMKQAHSEASRELKSMYRHILSPVGLESNARNIAEADCRQFVNDVNLLISQPLPPLGTKEYFMIAKVATEASTVLMDPILPEYFRTFYGCDEAEAIRKTASLMSKASDLAVEALVKKGYIRPMA